MPRPLSELEKVELAFRKRFSAQEAEANKALAKSYRQAARHLDGLWRAAYARMQAAQDAGATLDYLSGFIWSEQRLANLLVQAAQIGQALAQNAGSRITHDVATAAQLAQQSIDAGLVAALGPDVAVYAGHVALPVDAINTITARTDDGSPIQALARQYGEKVPDTLKTALIEGISNGENPNVVARRLAKAFGADFGKLTVITRTEMLRAYRDVHQAVFAANKRIYSGWWWCSAADERTCPICWAMHGTKHGLDEKMDTHPACRCSMVPIVRPWSEINPALVGVPPGPEPPDGLAMFDALPQASKRAILGPMGAEAYRRGMFTLPDLVKPTWHPVWGAGRGQRSLTSVIGPGNMKALGGFMRGGIAGPLPGRPGLIVPIKPVVIAPPKPKALPKPRAAKPPKAVATPLPPAIPPPLPVVASGPTGTPISQAVNGLDALPKKGKTGATGDAIKEAVAAIDRTHGDGLLNVVNVEIKNQSTAHGSYASRLFQGQWQPAGIKITSSTDGHPRLTMAHEMGHYLDQQWLGKTLGQSSYHGYASNRFDTLGPELEAWHKATQQSKSIATIKSLNDAARKGTGNYARDKENLRYGTYLLTPHETWARSYAQYVAVRGGAGDSAWAADVAAIRNSFHPIEAAGQWADDDFEPIAEAFDNLFRKLGGRK
jgi:SPP1 gp7 family putative phage head morphogenesis protein